jgi:hypothetical protein
MSLRPAAAIVLLCLAGAAAADEYTWPNFDKASGLQLNGNAQITQGNGKGILRLTTPASGKKGSVFTTFGVDDTGFHTAFSFRVRDSGGNGKDCKGKSGGEGFAFVLQGESPDAIGDGGGGLGYAGIADHLAIEFDTFCNPGYDDISSNHIAIVSAGVELAAVQIPHEMDDGNVRYVWIDYDGTKLDVRMSGIEDEPGDPDLSLMIDVPAVVGGPICCAGFTASTGEDVVAKHLILSWTYLELPSSTTMLAPDADRRATAVIRPVCRNRVGTSSTVRSVAQ